MGVLGNKFANSVLQPKSLDNIYTLRKVLFPHIFSGIRSKNNHSKSAFLIILHFKVEIWLLLNMLENASIVPL